MGMENFRRRFLGVNIQYHTISTLFILFLFYFILLYLVLLYWSSFMILHFHGVDFPALSCHSIFFIVWGIVSKGQTPRDHQIWKGKDISPFRSSPQRAVLVETWDEMMAMMCEAAAKPKPAAYRYDAPKMNCKGSQHQIWQSRSDKAETLAANMQEWSCGKLMLQLDIKLTFKSTPCI